MEDPNMKSVSKSSSPTLNLSTITVPLPSLWARISSWTSPLKNSNYFTLASPKSLKISPKWLSWVVTTTKNLLIGVRPFLPSRTKDNAVHAGPLPPLVPWKPFTSSRLEIAKSIPNNPLLIAPTMTTMDVKVVCLTVLWSTLLKMVFLWEATTLTPDVIINAKLSTLLLKTVVTRVCLPTLLSK